MAMDVVGHMLLQLDLYALEGKQDQLLDCLMTILHRLKSIFSPQNFGDLGTRGSKRISLKLQLALS